MDRFTRTTHAENFVLKGGILLAAYGVRRPTKDADTNAIGADVTADHLIAVVQDIAAAEVDDGVVCETELDQQMALVASYLDPTFSDRDTSPPHA